MTSTADTVVRISPDAVFRELSDGMGVLLHLESGQYHNVNEVGAQICRELAEPRSVAELVAAVRAAHPDAGDEVESDVTEFVDAMVARDLMVRDAG
jgi:hypothetical protein